MTDKDSPGVRTRRRVDDTLEKREKVVGGAEAGTRQPTTIDESGGRVNRVHADVRIRAHHTNAELKMMRERASGFDGQNKRF